MAANNAASGTPASGSFAVQVVSSARDLVTGGDGRLYNDGPHTVPLHQVDLWINGWRGLSPLALNPLDGPVANQQLFEPLSAIAATEWNHFADIVNIFSAPGGTPRRRGPCD